MDVGWIVKWVEKIDKVGFWVCKIELFCILAANALIGYEMIERKQKLRVFNLINAIILMWI